MLIDTIRFGQVEVDPDNILTFAKGLPGLEEYQRFSMLQFEAGNPIFWLQCVTAPSICLPVADAFTLEPAYAFDLADDQVKELGLESQEELHVLVVLVIPESIQGMTANLAAPVLINTRTGQAMQIILGGGEWGVRVPIFTKICQLLKGGEAHAGAQPQDK